VKNNINYGIINHINRTIFGDLDLLIFVMGYSECAIEKLILEV